MPLGRFLGLIEPYSPLRVFCSTEILVWSHPSRLNSTARGKASTRSPPEAESQSVMEEWWKVLREGREVLGIAGSSGV